MQEKLKSVFLPGNVSGMPHKSPYNLFPVDIARPTTLN